MRSFTLAILTAVATMVASSAMSQTTTSAAPTAPGQAHQFVSGQPAKPWSQMTEEEKWQPKQPRTPEEQAAATKGLYTPAAIRQPPPPVSSAR